MVGTPSYEAARLIEAARANWAYFDGDCAYKGTDPSDLYLGRFCNLVEFWLAEHMEPSQWATFKAALKIPPPDAVEEPLIPEDDAAEGQQFMAFMNAITGGKGVSSDG